MHEALLDSGIHLVDLGDRAVDLLVEGDPSTTPIRIEVKTWTRPMGPAQIADLARTLPNRHLLLIAPSFSVAAQDQIDQQAWSWISTPATGPVRGRLRLPGRSPIELGGSLEDVFTTQQDPPRGRRPWRKVAIIRHLLLRSTWTQRELADVCQTTQARVSQVLKELQNDRFVARLGRSHDGFRWIVADYDALFERWLSTYPGPGGAAPTYWYGLDGIVQQVSPVVQHLAFRAASTHPSEVTAVVSGDAAADFIAPYRRSQISVVYSTKGADLSNIGLTPAPAKSATLKLVVPVDISVWPSPLDNRSSELAPNAPFPLADPLQIAWDLIDTGRPDADQAVKAIKKRLLELRERDLWE